MRTWIGLGQPRPLSCAMAVRRPAEGHGLQQNEIAGPGPGGPPPPLLDGPPDRGPESALSLAEGRGVACLPVAFSSGLRGLRGLPSHRAPRMPGNVLGALGERRSQCLSGRPSPELGPEGRFS